MKKLRNIAHRQDFLKGYSIGLDPFLEFNSAMQNGAFIAGFNSGRIEYERMNGCISNGIPKRIVTEKILEDFLIAGLLGLAIDDEGYTAHQVAVILEWYQSGIEKYEPDHSIALFEVLEVNGIQMS